MVPKVKLQEFDKWVVDFVGPISPIGKRKGAHYIITAIDYLTTWVEAMIVNDCIVATTMKFIFENCMTRFGFPNILITNQGTHFFNPLIEDMTVEFQI